MAARSLLAAVGLGLTLAACAGLSTGSRRWEARFGVDHPLTGRVWDVAASRFVEVETLVDDLAAAPFVLLGERHDHPDHHRLQARLVRDLAAAGRRPAVAFEQLGVDQAPALARHLASAPRNAAGLGEAVGWARSGWPEWRLYRPIAQAALDAGLPIVAANLPTGTARAVVRGEAEALDRALVARWQLDQPPPAAIAAAMAAEIQESHCGQAPKDLIPGMIAAQRARDAQMAERLLEAASDGAVLIAGAGHVRRDWGVPTYLMAERPAVRVASLAFVEVRADDRPPGAYATGSATADPLYDYVWFTPRVDDVDPCEKFGESLRRLRKRP